MKLLLALALTPKIALALAPDLRRPWEGVSDPLIMSSTFERRLQYLPLKGRTKGQERFWSGDYWANKKGSINYRWYAREKIGFDLDSPSKEEARRMSIPELAALSPSEKYDLFTG